MRIVLDAEKCTGHGVCYDLASDLITDDDYGRGSVTQFDVPPELLDAARQARDNCPERAISLQDE